VSASVALCSQVNGGLPDFGRPGGQFVVRALSGSPLCKWPEKLIPDSIAWIAPITYQGIPSGLPTRS
jgi:hypothetical protein